jgi:hypothetical protein
MALRAWDPNPAHSWIGAADCHGWLAGGGDEDGDGNGMK